GGCRRPSATGRPGHGRVDRRLRRAAAHRARRPRAPGGPLRRAGALDRRATAVGEGGTIDLEPPAGPLRRPHPHSGGDPRRGSRGAAGGGRLLARQGRLPALAGRARGVGRARPGRAAAPGRRGGGRRAHRGQGRRRLDGAHVPDVHPAPSRRAAGRRPRRAQRGARRLWTRVGAGSRRAGDPGRALAPPPHARLPLPLALARQRAVPLRRGGRL
ncbi:MAG: DNA-3-methyladenine glycosylase II, partial [uncultured Solirubrobacteraceae bacterium]